MSDEEWAPVVGWEGRYEVSDRGRVRSLRRNMVISTPPNSRGYPHVRLAEKGTRRSATVHKMVLTAFRGAAASGQICRHLNDNKLDNRLSNLVWGSCSENTYDKVRNGNHPRARQTHCKRGHPLSGENLRLKRQAGGTSRVCRTCTREWNTAKRERSRRVA